MLTVVAFSHLDPSRGAMWSCRCDCGGDVITRGSSLRSGNTRSCGCRKTAGMREALVRHGMAGSAEYRAWRHMLNRCYRLAESNYADYGGRGIVVCDRWRTSFENFYADMGARPGRGYSIDRINVNGNYEPSNCRWATCKEQCNNRRSNRLLCISGEKASLSQWRDRLNLSPRRMRTVLAKMGDVFTWDQYYALMQIESRESFDASRSAA